MKSQVCGHCGSVVMKPYGSGAVQGQAAGGNFMYYPDTGAVVARCRTCGKAYRYFPAPLMSEPPVALTVSARSVKIRL